MRTKTPEQIFAQNQRIFDAVVNQCGRTPKGKKTVKKVSEITNRYVDNIYKFAGIPDHGKSEEIERCNYIYRHTALPASIYAKTQKPC